MKKAAKVDDPRYSPKERYFVRPAPLAFAFCASHVPDGPLDIFYTSDYRAIEFKPWDSHTALVNPQGEIKDVFYRTPEEAAYWYKKIKDMVEAANKAERELSQIKENVPHAGRGQA